MSPLSGRKVLSGDSGIESILPDCKISHTLSTRMSHLPAKCDLTRPCRMLQFTLAVATVDVVSSPIRVSFLKSLDFTSKIPSLRRLSFTADFVSILIVQYLIYYRCVLMATN